MAQLGCIDCAILEFLANYDCILLALICWKNGRNRAKTCWKNGKNRVKTCWKNGKNRVKTCWKSGKNRVKTCWKNGKNRAEMCWKNGKYGDVYWATWWSADALQGGFDRAGVRLGKVCFAHRRSFRAFRARWLGAAVHLCGGKGLINGFFVVSLQLEFTGTGCSVVIVALQWIVPERIIYW